jgi:putative Holliday junction resolvase
LTVLRRGGSRAADHAAIAAIVFEYEAKIVVVGLPLTLAGDVGPAARAAIDEASAIAKVVGVPVETFDERLTTVAADAILMERRMRAEARRRLVDKVAAAVMLQAWLDARDSA